MSRLIPRIPKPASCTVWRHQMNAPCENRATTWMYGPGDVNPIPGEKCEECSKRLTAEISAELGEKWTYERAELI